METDKDQPNQNQMSNEQSPMVNLVPSNPAPDKGVPWYVKEVVSPLPDRLKNPTLFAFGAITLMAVVALGIASLMGVKIGGIQTYTGV